MKYFVPGITAACLLILFYTNAGAIIILPALVLIPIAKIVGLILGLLSLPTVGLGAVLAKITKNSAAKGVLIALGILLLAGLIMAVVIKLVSPDQPLT